MGFGIGATIRIGREIQCLLNVGFLFVTSKLEKYQLYYTSPELFVNCMIGSQVTVILVVNGWTLP